MKTRILATLIFLALAFCAEGTNPGKTIYPPPKLPKPDDCPCPSVDTGCLRMTIPFGRPVNQPGIRSGRILLEVEKPSAFLFSPQSLTFDFIFDSFVVDVKTNPVPLISREVTIRQKDGWDIVYQFKTGESLASPAGQFIDSDSKLRMVDSSGNPVTDNPAFYERLFQDGYRIRFPAQQFTMVKPSVITPQGLEITPDAQGVSVLSAYDNNGAIRQIWSAADGLADIVVINSGKYEIRLYAPENTGSKNAQGFYEPQGNPYELWTVENTSQIPARMDMTRITRTVAGTSYVYDCRYTEATDSWTITSGGGLRKSSIYYYGDFSIGPCKIIEETRAAANNLAEKTVLNSTLFPWRPMIVNKTVVTGGEDLTTAYAFYENSSQTGKYGRLSGITYPDGSSTGYDYDTLGRITLVSSSYLDSASAKVEYYSYTPLDAADVPGAYDGRPRTIETKILGTTVNKKYFVYKPVNGEAVEIQEEGLAAFGDSANQRKTTVYYASSAGDASKGRIKSITWPDGKKDSYTYEYGIYSSNPDPASYSFSAGTGDVLRQTIVHGTVANPAGVAGKSTKEINITDGRANKVMTETYAYDGADYTRVIWNVKTFDAQHHVLASYDSNNTYSTATWNCCLKDSETMADGTAYSYSYNPLQQLVSKTKTGGPTTTYAHDVMVRKLSQTISGEGVSLATSATYDLAGRVTSSTDAAGLVTTYAYSNGGRTVTATLPGGFTQITDKYFDGKIKSITGTAVIAKYYTYGANQDGSQWTKVYTAVENGSSYAKITVDAFGRTAAEERPGATGTLATNYFYSSQGLLTKNTSTGNADTLYAYDDFNNQIRTALDLNANGSIDLGSVDRVSESETSFQSDASQWWSVSTSKVYGDSGAVTTGISKRKLTGLGSGVIAESRSIDINGNETVSTTTLDRTSKTIVQTVNTPDSNVDSVSTTVNGLLVSQRTSANLTYNFSYDGIERKIGDADPRTGASVTHYNALGQIDYVQDAAGKQTSFTYEAATGRKSSVINALNKATSYTYNSRGQIISVRGDASYPLDYSYDTYGRMTQLLTYRDANLANPDITTWGYQESTGLLASKTYADNKSVSYTYSLDGKIATRTWSRGVVTTYGYNTAGDLTGITYSDTTPAVGFTYNRLGQQLTVTDAVGSRTFGYNGVFQLTSEAITGIYNKTLSRSYDILGRSSSMNIATEYAVGYGYDNLGRFSTVTSGTDTFTYSYLAGSNLISGISYPNNISVTKSYEATRDLVTSIENKYGTTTISKYDYTNDDLGRRTAMGKSGTAFSQADTISYGYNDRSEVTSALAQNQTTYNYGFQYGPLGNRLTSSSTETGTSVTRNYTSNNLNQYTAIDNPTAVPTYDDDGNTVSCPLSSGNWTMTWDAENRLIAAEKTGQRLEFKYDYASRRVEKRVLVGGSEASKERFVYGGFRQIERLNALDSNSIVQKFIWHAGKIFAMENSSGTCYYSHDANKNVTELIDASGTVKAHYEYPPFGKIIVQSGDYADENPIRFSSEYYDYETGLMYYNFRYYSFELGKWLCRDPVEENGGENLYGFLGNSPIDWWDYLGLRDDLIYLPINIENDNALIVERQYWEDKQEESKGTNDTITIIYAKDPDDARGQTYKLPQKKYDRIIIGNHANEGYAKVGDTRIGPEPGKNPDKFKTFLELLVEYSKKTTIIRYEGCFVGHGEKGKNIIEETVKITKLTVEAYNDETVRGAISDKIKTFRTKTGKGELLRGHLDGGKVIIETITGDARNHAELK